jgi:hypothetical protein
MAERGGSLKWGLACATACGFQRFRARIKAGVEGFSPRGIPGSGGHRKVACDGKDYALVLSKGGRELQGAESTRSLPTGCGTASASSLGSRRGPKHR